MRQSDEMLLMLASTAIPVFVYGTLRPGQPLYGLLSEAVLSSEKAALHDFTLRVKPGFPYPVITSMPGAVVRGDVLWCAPGSKALRQVILMEEQAGYDAVLLDVETDMLLPIHALAFTMPVILADRLGWVVSSSSDWVDAKQEAPGWTASVLDGGRA